MHDRSSPLEWRSFIVGLNAATRLSGPFTSYWSDATTGFDRQKFDCDYREVRLQTGNRPRIEAIAKEIGPCPEVTCMPSLKEGQQLRRNPIICYLFRAIRPELVAAATHFTARWRGGLMSGQRPADYGYYRRTGTDAHRFGGQATCDNRSVRSDKLEQAVWAEVQAVLKDPARLADEYQRRISEAQTGGGARDDINTLDPQIARLRSGIGPRQNRRRLPCSRSVPPRRDTVGTTIAH